MAAARRLQPDRQRHSRIDRQRQDPQYRLAASDPEDPPAAFEQTVVDGQDLVAPSATGLTSSNSLREPTSNNSLALQQLAALNLASSQVNLHQKHQQR